MFLEICGPVLMYVPSDDDEIAELRVLDRGEQPIARRDCAIPFVQAGAEHFRIGVAIVARDDHLLGEQIPARPRAPEPIVQPALLSFAEHGAVWLARFGALGFYPGHGSASLGRAVLSRIENVHRQ